MTDILSNNRELFNDEHDAAREMAKLFIADRIVPRLAEWEVRRQVPRSIWQEAGELGLLCPTIGEEYGGLGGDFLFSAVVAEELAYAHASGPGFIIHSEMATPYIANFGTEEQKHRWLPGLVAGTSIAAIAMTESDAGSDLRGIRTRATRTQDGYVLSGQKVFISNGQLADLVIVAAKMADTGRLTLFVVEADMPGFTRGRVLEKIGQHAQDTSELFFEDVKVPRTNLIGEEGEGFKYLRAGLARERLIISIGAQARAEATYRDTVAYVSDRQVFGAPLSEQQNTRFVLASVRADLAAGRSLVDALLQKYVSGGLDETTAAMGKLWTTEMLGRTADACLQLFGGWGYMREYPIARVYEDARVERIAGGTSEIMRDLIARDIFA